MIKITPEIEIDEKEIQLDFVYSSGPGGQNVNKVASAVQLRFDVEGSDSLKPEVKQQLAKLAGRRITGEGILIIEAKRFRTQEQNRVDAWQRLISLIQKAAEKPQIRKATHPSKAAKAARLSEKKKRGEIKKKRRINPKDLE